LTLHLARELRAAQQGGNKKPTQMFCVGFLLCGACCAAFAKLKR
jgi:hypothetical protein